MDISRSELLQLISFIDLTSLESTDNTESVIPLINKANDGFDGTFPAAVCVYPNLGKVVSERVNSGISVAVVGGSFPSGQTIAAAKIAELQSINMLPVHEVDIVINRGLILQGKYDLVAREIKAMRDVIPNKKLKVIIESGELKTPELIRKASAIAIENGADFIKTSTGKSSVGATTEVAKVMCEVIHDFLKNDGIKIGFKPSGGIKTVEQALIYRNIVRDILGDEWLHPDYFRIGASSLYDALIKQIGETN